MQSVCNISSTIWSRAQMIAWSRISFFVPVFASLILIPFLLPPNPQPDCNSSCISVLSRWQPAGQVFDDPPTRRIVPERYLLIPNSSSLGGQKTECPDCLHQSCIPLRSRSRVNVMQSTKAERCPWPHKANCQIPVARSTKTYYCYLCDHTLQFSHFEKLLFYLQNLVFLKSLHHKRNKKFCNYVSG